MFSPVLTWWKYSTSTSTSTSSPVLISWEKYVEINIYIGLMISIDNCSAEPIPPKKYETNNHQKSHQKSIAWWKSLHRTSPLFQWEKIDGFRGQMFPSSLAEPRLLVLDDLKLGSCVDGPFRPGLRPVENPEKCWALPGRWRFDTGKTKKSWVQIPKKGWLLPGKRMTSPRKIDQQMPGG